ncbi:hypothetical protein [Streptomyces sp. NPDC047453]|uniref:hypothetical protein n=1 Tax=Streptomyces sp. NPDC047453 TaxID=3154812 RepID=UPI0033F6E1E5
MTWDRRSPYGLYWKNVDSRAATALWVALASTDRDQHKRLLILLLDGLQHSLGG